MYAQQAMKNSKIYIIWKSVTYGCRDRASCLDGRFLGNSFPYVYETDSPI